MFGIVAFLGGIALAVAICAYPAGAPADAAGWSGCRRASSRSGAGDLGARVKVEGKDEVARLAESFNSAAARIEELVGAHKLLLANASHELRTPLSRIRLGVELLKEGADPKRKRELEKDIAELDALIDEILLSSRLDAVKGLDQREEVDLLALAAEEGARYEHCSVTGTPVDRAAATAALLRRMMRNLIENAERHGAPPIEVEVAREGAQARSPSAITARALPRASASACSRRSSASPASRRASGTGLGLTLVRQIARQHGGDALWVGTPERPSRIRVVLPAAR